MIAKVVRRSLGMLFVGSIVAVPASAQDSGIALGEKAPAAAVNTLEGKPANLDQYIGKTPVLS